MKKTLLSGNRCFHYFSLIALVFLPLFKGLAQVSLTGLGATYTQNFNTLANSGTSSSVPTGWAFAETGTNANSTYAAGTGSGSGGDTYSFGSAAADRAFGSLQSGSCIPTLGASFTNNTGSIITSLDIAYTGEQWRCGAVGRNDQLTFEYSLNATSLTTGLWTPVSALTFSSPATTAIATLDGNLPANRISISSTISSLAILNGTTVWIRWTDFNATGSDDGLSIDDFSLTPNGGAPVVPTKLAITTIAPASPFATTGFSVVVQAQDVTNIARNVILPTAFSLSTNGNAGSLGGTISGSIPAGVNSVTLTGVTLATAGTAVNLTATRTSGDVLTAGTSANFTVIGNATHLVFVNAPTTGFVSTDIASFTIEARRADNTVDINYTSNITVSKASGPGSLSGTTVAAAVAGVATFSSLQFDQIGAYTLNAASGALTPTVSSGITISPSPVTWNFTTANPSAGVPVSNLSVSAITQGNNLGSTTLITNASSSSGYTGASGTFNAGAAARTGAINTSATGSAYFEFTLTPALNNFVVLNSISFGSRSTSTGPQAFSLRSSVDNYVTDLATQTLPNNQAWVSKSVAVTSATTSAGNAITYRIYGHSGVGTAGSGTANWRIDDLMLGLDVQPCVLPTINVNSGAICAGNSFTIMPSGGVSYTVTGNSFTVNPTTTMSYTVAGSDINGCQNTAVSSVTVNALPNVSVNSGPVCIGNSFTMTPTGATSYVYSSGTNVVSPTANTDYTVTGTDGNNCSNTAVSSVTVNALPNVAVNSGTICDGSSFTLTPTGAVSYVYSSGGDIVSPSVTTNYTVTGTDGNGCENTAVSSVTVNATPNISVNSGTINIGSSFTMTPSGATSYTFSSGSAVVTPTVNSTYTVTGSSALGCINSTGAVSTVIVNGASIPTTQLTTLWCNTTLATLDASVRPRLDAVSGAVDYEWQFTDLATNTVVFTRTRNAQWTDFYLLSYFPSIQYNKTYSIKVRAKVGNTWGAFGSACTITTPTAVAVPTQLTPADCNSTLTSFNTTTTIRCNPVTGATNYEWEFTDVSNPALKYTRLRNAQWPDFYVKAISQLALNKTYSVIVRSYVNGVWSAYGSACTITTPAIASRFANEEEETVDMNNVINVSAYPNPASEILNIDFDNMPENASVEVYNMVGELVLTQNLTGINNTINTSTLSNGLYHAKVIGNNKLISVQKIVKQ
jgi:hypothetical protein